MHRTLPLLLLALLALWTGNVPHEAACDEGLTEQERQPQLFGVRDSNAARYAVAEMRTALAAGQTVRGLRAAQRVLDEMVDDFHLEESASSPESTLWRSAAEVVREQLERLGPEQREVYETLSQPSSGPLLERSLRRLDEAGLRAVLRRFGAARSGQQAARLLADLALESGRLRDAARYLREALRYNPTDPLLWTRLIDALRMAGNRGELEALVLPAALAESDPQGLAALQAQRQLGLDALPGDASEAGLFLWGGRAARNGVAPAAPARELELRWIEALDWQERRYDRVQYGFLRGAIPAAFRDLLDNLRPIVPVVDEDSVYVSDGRSVRCYDLLTARERWKLDARSGTRLPLFPPRVRADGRTSLDRVYSPVVAGDVVLATVELYRPYRPEILQGVVINTYLPHRALVAVERETGALRWELGGDDLEALIFADASVLSPPVVAEGLAIALLGSYDGKHDVQMVGVDLRSGRLRWRRPLGFGQQELNLFGHPLKELAATPITVSDGVAYVATGLGFVAAVDIRSGVPRWLASYQILPVHPVDLWYATPLRTPHVATSPPVVQGDVLVIAPPDGRHVHAFDRRTGRLLWREPYVTDGIFLDAVGHFLGVVHDGRRDVVVLTDHQLRARDLQTGKQAWFARIEPRDARILGRGVIAGTEILLPTGQGLQRFALDREGAFKGSTPWPALGDAIAEPGNLVVTPRVVLVATRDSLLWLYDWPALERDLERRRREQPADPTVLLEAGEIYLRTGAPAERARRVFEEALRLAERAQDAASIARAQDGLHGAWMREGEQAGSPELAITAWRKAMLYARTPTARVALRQRLHETLPPGSSARVENLEALIEEGANAYAVFRSDDGEVPVRVGALFLLAEEHESADRPALAVDALQRVLREAAEIEFPEGSAGERARRDIARLVDRAGALAYHRHEEAARALLEQARHSGEGAPLERLLAEYPNARAVVAALLLRSRQLRAAGMPEESAARLRELLGRDPPPAIAAQALADLALTWRELGGRGAARYALVRLREQYGREPVEPEPGQKMTGAEFAAQELARDLPTSASAQAPLCAPLSEAHFEPAGEDEYARPVQLDGDPALGPDAGVPVALMNRGEELVAIDLRSGRVAWSAPLGVCQRAVWIDNVLVLALSRMLLAVELDTGREIWRQGHEVAVREMAVSQGQVFLLAQDLSVVGGSNLVRALDAFMGEELWTRELGREDHRDLRPMGDLLVLERVHFDRRGPRSVLLCLDGFAGELRHEVQLPFTKEGEALLVGTHYVLAGRTADGRGAVLAAYDLATGLQRWQRGQEGLPACALAATGDQVVALQPSGDLLVLRAADGGILRQTRIYVGEGARACPFPQTPLLAEGDRVLLFPWVRNPAPGVMAFDTRTGKLLWEAPGTVEASPSKATLVGRAGMVLVMTSHSQQRAQHVVLRLIDGKTGALLQEIVPEGLARANWMPSLIEGHGSVVLYGKTGASIFRSGPPSPR